MATTTNKKHFSGGLAKVLAERWQVDVRLKAVNSDESSAISAHKVILASRSEVFKKMLESDEVKTSSKHVETITLSEMKHEELEAFVKSIYSDESSAISAHKLILASRSEVFKKMLESDEVKTSGKHVDTITLSEMKQEELEAFVEFIYSDGSILSAKAKEHARSLYLAGDKYEILHLRDLCRNELIASLSLSNSLDILELAQIPFDKDLNDAAFSYIKKNITTIASSDQFKLFVVSSPNLTVEIVKASLTQTSTLSCSNCGYNNNQHATNKRYYGCGNYALRCI